MNALRPHDDALARGYLLAKHRIVAAGYSLELAWQESTTLETVTERHLLREAAWVILSAGLSVSAVRAAFPRVSSAFLGLGSAATIYEDGGCVERALSSFNHRGKLRAIETFCTFVAEQGFSRVRAALATSGAAVFRGLPYLGPVTTQHLAKNLGLPVAKDDRHLRRTCDALGFPSAQILCEHLSSLVLDSVSVVDLVLWRYAVIERDYAKMWRDIN